MSGSATVLHAPREEVGYEDVACLPPPEAADVEHSQVPTVRYHHVVSRVDAPSWHDTINLVSTLSFVVNDGLYWLLNSVCTTFAGHQWNANDQRMHQQSHPTRSTEVFTLWTNKHALAAD
jgi:hypothetical protein